MKLKATSIIIAVILIGIVGIGGSKLLGLWATESTKTPARFQNVDGFEGDYRADDIRGSYTFGEISKLYQIPLPHLVEAFGVPIDQGESFKCKDLETLYANQPVEIGTGSVKLFVAFYLGQPYSLSESTYLLPQGKQVIEAFGKPTPEQLAYLNDHTIGENTVVQKKEPESALDSSQPQSSSETRGESSGQNQGQSGQGLGAGSGSGATAQLEMKGSTYLKDLAKEHQIPLEDFAVAFGLSKAEAENFQVKDIKNKFAGSEKEIGTGTVAMFVAFYKGMEYDLSDATAYFPKECADILLEKGSPTQEQQVYLESHTMP